MAIVEELNSDNSTRREKTVKAKKSPNAAVEASVSKTEDISLRSKSLDEIIGREKEKRKLRILIKSAQSRKDVIDHILFYGPPGIGKTTFGYALAQEFGSNFISTSGPGITSKAEIASIISSLNEGDFLFIDEIHRLNKVLEEFLYPILEDFKMDLSLGKGSLSFNRSYNANRAYQRTIKR
jgi:Holliday junction resolvasome RuvABC ATP-dependent DNA helicase subunit